MSFEKESFSGQIKEQSSLVGRVILFCLTNKLVIAMLVIFFIGWGVIVAPFDWDISGIERRPVAVDAIPDIGENQQIVFTEWPGRSPQDIEDQISYPLTVSLLGVPGVKTVRSYSSFGFSSVYIIFEEGIDFYWSRSRVLEKLSSLPSGTLPDGVRPSMGPDATALGQIFWYTLEGRDSQGNPAGGWNLEELRTIQDWQVRYALNSVSGVSEVASVGGFVREYQVDVDPDAMRAYGVSLSEVYNAVKNSNIDVGAKNLELNNVEYIIRGVGFIKNTSDIEDTVVKVVDNIPVLVKNIAIVSTGPALRRGGLDKGGAEAVGGVVVARYGDNPLRVIKNVQAKIDEISHSLPSKVHIDFTQVSDKSVREFAESNGFNAYKDGSLDNEQWLQYIRSLPEDKRPQWASISKVTLVPFYDRSELIYETLGTLNSALSEEILITIIVVLLMVMHLRSSLLISGLLPLAVLMCFIAMKIFGVDANIVALSGIAIAIGTMVDMGIVICENILRQLGKASPQESKLNIVHRASSEVGSAVLTAVATTVVSFLPVFAMTGSEGKLFKPLAFTKTFALIASVIVALMVIPPAAHILFCHKRPQLKKVSRMMFYAIVFLISIAIALSFNLIFGVILLLLGLYYCSSNSVTGKLSSILNWVVNIVAVIFVGVLLSSHWEPIGPQKGLFLNFIFVAIVVGAVLFAFWLFRVFYPRILSLCLRHKVCFLSLPVLFLILGGCIWLGFDKVFAPVGEIGGMKQTDFWASADNVFPGLGKEFMPSLDEGSFLYMPTTMAHASIGEAMDVLSKQDMALQDIPEVDSVVGKIGRAQTPLDPAPISMVETVINYKPEYITDKNGRRVKFRYDRKKYEFVRDDFGELIVDDAGQPYRQWRDEIKNPDDIWEKIVEAATIEGTTSAPKLQPIAARIVMLQSGMRAPMGVKVKGPSLETIEDASLQIESLLKQVETVRPQTVIADRIVGKPYLEIVPDRKALARYGVSIRSFQDVVEIAIGGSTATSTVEGRERFAVRVRYQRELRDSIEALPKILVTSNDGVHIPLGQLAEIRYVRGPQVIKSEDTFLTGYVLFDMIEGGAEVDVVENCKAYLETAIEEGRLLLPAGVSYSFAGNYQNQIRSQKTLAIVLPLSLFVIFLILYMQFRSVSTTLLVFSGILVAWSGGFLLVWLYGQGWFMNFELFGTNIRDFLQIKPINLSVAVWVGFLALFGIASDDGVVMATYLTQSFRDKKQTSLSKIRELTISAGQRRVRACLMTTATTLLALLPVLTSQGRGSDVMVPMAIPVFGGMAIEFLTMLIVPVLYCAIEELKFKMLTK
ncbi:MAG: efflux RND transporter permease subunit [Sedimentisphaeraceae bacterium JB056]